ncbi:MAG: acyl-CoA dehydrogenase, partial [Pseudonocardiales bacterium]|nr:acyl-CoA dehydrogenase [Pseudonocardiales bacterium]
SEAWRKHWTELAELGLFAVALPGAVGGAGGSVADLAVMLEAAAEALVPGPVVTTALAGLLLARTSEAAATELLPRLADGTISGAVGLSTGSVRATRRAGGGLTVDGSAGPVLGADSRSLIVLSARVDADDVWFGLDADAPGVHVVEQVPADFSRSLAEVRLDGVEVAPDRLLGDVSTPLVVGRGQLGDHVTGTVRVAVGAT